MFNWYKKWMAKKLSVKDKLVDNLFAKGVHTVVPGTKVSQGRDTGEPALKVFVEKKQGITSLRDEDIVPGKISGVKTDVEEMPMPKAFADRSSYDPIRGGIEIGPKGVGFVGTLGGLYTRRTYITKGGRLLYLFGRWLGIINLLERWGLGPQIKKEIIGTTNSHVANPSVLDPKYSSILQPGVSGRHIGKVLRSEPIDKDGWNEYDWAIIKISDSVDFLDDIYEVGTIKKVLPPGNPIGEKVLKRGRTTELTHGTVVQYPASSRINYGADGILKFKNLAIISTDSGLFSDSGDSGSDIPNEDLTLKWKLFAGGGGITLAFPVYKMFKKDKLSLIDLDWTVYKDD